MSSTPFFWGVTLGGLWVVRPMYIRFIFTWWIVGHSPHVYTIYPYWVNCSLSILYVYTYLYTSHQVDRRSPNVYMIHFHMVCFGSFTLYIHICLWCISFWMDCDMFVPIYNAFVTKKIVGRLLLYNMYIYRYSS